MKSENVKSESTVLREICDWLATRPDIFFWRNNNFPVWGRAMPKYTPKGLPDIFAINLGTIYALEVKRPSIEGAREANGRALRKGMLTSEQAEWGVKLEAAGGRYFCVRSLGQVQDIFKAGSQI